MVPDGRYDAIVVDAEEHPQGGVAVSLTLLAGPHKGEVLDLHTGADLGEPLDLLGIPATLTVVDGQPSLQLEP